MKRSILILTLLSFSILMNAQSTDTRENFNYNIKITATPVVLDGELNEESWAEAPEIENFYNHWPLDSGLAKSQTKVKITYDNDFLYIAAICYDNGKRVVQSLKRDSDSYWSSDAFTVGIDPINTRTNGFFFGVNAAGAQIEGTLTMRGNWTENDTNWDNKWFSATKEYENYWVAEFAIPFKTLRFNNSNTFWGINFIRNDMENNAYTTWTRFPNNFGGLDLGHTGLLSWDKAPPVSKGKVVLIPYTSGGINRNHEEGENTKQEVDAGIDAKIALTSSLNLDLTLNPDFSNVDVDQQQTNLTRFSLFFPEKRNFFLENSDLFSNFGTWHTRPFFSRRIGLNNGEPIPILYGARLSGNATDNLRLGVMNIQTRKTDEFSAQNYSVAAAQHRVFERSNVKALFINRQATGNSNPEAPQDYNRLGGAEFQYTSKDGKLGGGLQYHYSDTPEKLEKSDYYSGEVYYNTRTFFTGYNYTKVGENFISDVGFAPRLDNYDPVMDTTVRMGYQIHNPWIGFNIYPANQPKVNRHAFRSWSTFTLNDDNSLNERLINVFYFLNFANQSNFRISVHNTEVNLPFEFALVDSDNPLPAQNYNYTEGRIGFSSDSRKAFSYEAGVNYGSFYNGEKITFNGSVNFRTQPWGNFGIAYLANKIDLPDPYGSKTLHLVGPTAEITFSNRMFWTSFLQYNTQAENFSINSRFQWRYKPMSDIFIVYTDNYASSDFTTKNRGIVFKITYWLNI